MDLKGVLVSKDECIGFRNLWNVCLSGQPFDRFVTRAPVLTTWMS